MFGNRTFNEIIEWIAAFWRITWAKSLSVAILFSSSSYFVKHDEISTLLRDFSSCLTNCFAVHHGLMPFQEYRLVGIVIAEQKPGLFLEWTEFGLQVIVRRLISEQNNNFSSTPCFKHLRKVAVRIPGYQDFGHDNSWKAVTSFSP